MLPNWLASVRIKHWLPCGADGRAGGRSVYGHVITKFSEMGRFTYPWCSAGALRAPELRYETMFTIGESRIISHSNDTGQQAQQVAGNPRFSTETPLKNAD